jgi:serine/threonine protein kinase
LTIETAGRFTLLRKLPAGGMGRVFEAEDGTNGRRVALKLIDLGPDRDSLQIVKAERLGAELQKQLGAIDKRVTEIYEAGEMPNYFYIVMEYVDGQDISEIAFGKGLPPGFAARVAQDVLEVLEHAHHFTTHIEGRPAKGIVHGDLKPRNIRVTPDGQVKVLDFGIAKVLSLTRDFTQNVFASAQYSSPERMKTGEVDISSDLWGVGVVLYEVLTGHAYFEADNGPKLEHMIRNYQQLRPLPADWPEPLRQIVARALDPNPGSRYKTAAEFAGALAQFRKGLAGTPEGQGWTVPSPDAEATRRVSQGNNATFRTQRPAPSSPVPSSPVPSSPVPFSPMFPAEIDATRRTTREPSLPAATPNARRLPWKGPLVRIRTPLTSLLRILSILVLIVFLAAAYFFLSQYVVWREAGQLARDVESEKQQNLDAAWQQYTKLESRSHLPLILWSAEDALRDRLMSDADHTIVKYEESNGPPVLESEWVHARNEVAHALELEPSDKTIHGKLRLIDGQLARIRGNARHDGGLLEESQQDFEDAAKYMKKSPDPWLGLARLYIYSLHDVEHAEAAFKEAERRGHDIGKRETAQLADGYRYEGERTMALGDHAGSAADGQRYYDLADKDLAHARQLYQSILPWGGAATNLKKVDQSESQIEARRSAHREP